MSQAHDAISDGKGSEVLTHLNQAFAALATLQSGEQEPVSPLPFMLWADTTTNRLKIRHSNNQEWITLGALDTPSIFMEADRSTGSLRQRLFKNISNVLTFKKKPTESSSNPAQQTTA